MKKRKPRREPGPRCEALLREDSTRCEEEAVNRVVAPGWGTYLFCRQHTNVASRQKEITSFTPL